MPLEINFNAAPYFDDYDPEKNFYRVLFKPSVAVQARELTQLQTILQDQIEKFGRHIFKDGSVIEGCTLNFDNNYNYIKVTDTTTDSPPRTINISDYVGKKVVSAANLQALIVNIQPGLESNAPDLNTLYIRYLNSTNYANGSQQKTFDADEPIFIQTTDDIPVANIAVANASYDPVGKGYAVSISEGTIFNKGVFVQVYPQTLIVSKYTNVPENVSVGFYTSESIVTADADNTLFDNALGSTNFNAPGAARLKLTANLVTRATDTVNTTVANTTNFFSIVDFSGGVPVLQRTDAQYAKLGTELARRTYEESGNYIVNPFELSVSANTTSPNNLVLEISKGLGYVQGYRVEYSDTNKVNLRKGTDTADFPNQIITANYGNYVIVKEHAGLFDVSALDEVVLYANSAATVLTNRSYTPTLAPGTAAPNAVAIGTAEVKAIEHFSGTPGTPDCQYKMYLFDIRITAGNYSFSDVRMIYGVNPLGVVGYADTVLVGGQAVLRETAASDMVFNLGARAVQSVNTTATSFIFRTTANAAFANTGVASLGVPTAHPGGSHAFPLTGALSEANELKFIVVPNTSVNGISAGFTVNVTSNSPNVDFSAANGTYLVVGDYVAVGNATTSNVRRVVSITNTTQIVCDANIGFVNTATNIARHFPAGVPISFARDDSANVSISGSTATFDLGTRLAGTSTFVGTFYFDVLRTGAIQATKTITRNRFVKIQANTHPTRNQGPWTLGIPDVTRIRGVYQGTTYSNTNTNNVRFFNLVTGQKGTHYDLSSIELKPNSGHTVGADDLLLVELDHFTPGYSGGIGYFSVNSYSANDDLANTTSIRTSDIPVFTSDTGVTYDLRDAIDARPYAANTANSSTTEGGATVNPSTTLTLSVGANGAYTLSPGQNFNTGFSYFLGRKDKVALSPEGKITLVEGAPGIEPVSPRDLDGTMTLGQLTIPPYPSLSQAEVRLFDRPEYGVSIDLLQNRRYTMRDIGVIDKKFARLEYYTSLSLLESSAKTAVIKDETGSERFKNGFIVDSFKGFATSDTKSQEYKASIDYKLEELGPTVKRTYIDLTFDSVASANVTKEGSLILLNGNTASYIEQPFASKTRNCVENIIYVWNGNITLSPEGDNQVDIDTNPDVVGNVDLSGLADLINALPSIRGNERIISTTTVSETSNRTTTGNITTTTRDLTAQTTETTMRSDIDFSASTLRSTFEFGEIVQDVTIQQFIKPKRVNFTASNLKPSTRVYAYFDGVAVSAHCTPTDSSFTPTDIKGGDLVSDSTGIVYGYFDIPAGVFKTGDRVFRMCDVDNIVVAADSVTTQAAATYTASNISITKARYALNTRLPQVAVNTTDIVTGTRTSDRLLSSQVVQVTQNEVNRPAAVDPIAQTFIINESSEDVAGVFIKKLDLYFRTKHPTLGVEVQIREVQNGFPTLNIVPFGRKTLDVSLVQTSIDASAATTFEFDTPVFLQSGVEYCFVVMPVGSNEGYNIWVGEVGGVDVKSGAPIYVNNSTGVLFTSSTNRVWTPFQKEDIKFVLHRRNFTANVGTVVYRNSNAEFLTARNFRGTNNFVVGEKIYVAQSNPVGTANVRCVDSSNAVGVVINTSFNALSFTVNRYVYISSNTGGTTEIRYITGIPNTTHIVLNSNMPFTDNNASIGYLQANGDLFGYLTRYSANNELMYLDQSTANIVSGFTNVAASGNALLIGVESKAIANLVSVDNVDYSAVVPQFSYVSPPGTSLALRMRGIRAAAATLEASNTLVYSDIETFFSDGTRRIRSRSNEWQDGANKGIMISIPMTTASNKTSPIIDDIKTDMLVFENVIGNTASSTNETAPGGGSGRAKYVSKRVALAEGQDAEDLQVYLNAYKPSNTDITVYGKFLSGQDSESIDVKAWSPLNQNTASSVVSSRADRNDFKEFMHDMPYKYAVNAASSTAMADWAIYGTFGNTAISANVITISNSSPLPIGSLVFFIGVNVATGISNGFYNILTANNTAIKLSGAGNSTEISITPTSSSNTGTLYHIPLTAFKDEYLSNVVSYYTRSGAHYHSYKTFAIKILMTSEEGSHIVPRVTDMRAIALQS